MMILYCASQNIFSFWMFVVIWPLDLPIDIQSRLLENSEPFVGFQREWSSRFLVAVRLQFLGDKVDGCRVTKHAQSTDDADCLVA